MTAVRLGPAGPGAGAWMLGAASLVVVGLLSLLIGPAGIAPGQVIRALANRLPGIETASTLTTTQTTIIFDLRLPRTVLAGLVGATLALAGAAYQGVFRNPLADPYLLGAAAGAGLGATAAIAGPGGAIWVPVLAFAGALGGVGLTYTVGRTLGDRTATTLILAGVAVASFLTALQTFLLQRNADTLREVYSFILGEFGTSGWDEVLAMLPYAVVAAVVILAHRRLLDVFSVGDEESRALGVNTARVRRWVVIAASLGTAAAVAVSGLIGFVGVIVPHTIRLMAGWSYRVVLPLAIVFGAAFMIVADLVGRTILSPAELPIGVVTAFFGAPFFIAVLRTTKGRL